MRAKRAFPIYRLPLQNDNYIIDCVQTHESLPSVLTAADCVFSRGYSLCKFSGNLAGRQSYPSYKPGPKRSQPSDPDCENAVSDGISLPTVVLVYISIYQFV